jgi:hypothetical protein
MKNLTWRVATAIREASVGCRTRSKSHRIADNTTSAEKAQNRRVVMRITERWFPNRRFVHEESEARGASRAPFFIITYRDQPRMIFS